MTYSKLVVGNLNNRLVEEFGYGVRESLQNVLSPNPPGPAQQVTFSVGVSEERRAAVIRCGYGGVKVFRCYMFDMGFPALWLNEWHYHGIGFTPATETTLDIEVQRHLDRLVVELGYTTIMILDGGLPRRDRLAELGYELLLSLPGDNRKRVLPALWWREVVPKEEVKRPAEETPTGFLNQNVWYDEVGTNTTGV